MNLNRILFPLLAFALVAFSAQPPALQNTTTLGNPGLHGAAQGHENTPPMSLQAYVQDIYVHPDLVGQLPAFPVFEKAMRGYLALQKSGAMAEREIITIIDFTLSSCKKRLWTIDLKAKKLLFHALVSHGKNTGEEYAQQFSNIPQSLQSSLGFYITGGTYQGKHGTSLYLDGAEKGFNDNARDRYIVMHGADYVSERFIQKHGRLGRSFGCPAVPYGLHSKIIEKIKGQTCLFIYYPDETYLSQSELVNASPEELVASLKF